jgi:hypothetical protein
MSNRDPYSDLISHCGLYRWSAPSGLSYRIMRKAILKQVKTEAESTFKGAS